jgi:lipopolysaccharide transport system permease protein
MVQMVEPEGSYPVSRANNTIILEAGKSDREYFRDLWRYRELFYVLAWRNVSVRYKQAVIGVAWAVLRPALTTLVLTVVFGKLGRLPSGGTPYALLVMAGMLPWQLFSAAVTDSGQSLISNANLITKIYFPRLIIPGSSLLTSVIDFGIGAVLLVILMIVYRVVPDWQIVFLPAFIVIALLAAAGIGAWISALTVRYRDFVFVVPFFVQLGLYASPVGFSTAAVPEKWRLLYSLNPMVGVIEGFRWCLLGGDAPVRGIGFFVSLAIVAIIALTGIIYFRKTERGFADVI